MENNINQYILFGKQLHKVSALHTRLKQKINLFHCRNQVNKRWLQVNGLDVICTFIEFMIFVDCFIKIAYIMLNKYSDSDSVILKSIDMFHIKS